jgi:serine/threonine protein kinase/Tfp pilus assembly protein PilF
VDGHALSDSPPALALAELLAEDMAQRWRRGQRQRVEDYLERHPELADSPEAVLELLAEEISLLQADGEEPNLADLERRFSRWQQQVRALLDCHQLLTAGLPPTFPEAGTRLGEFELLAELGRGAHARVFLARQLALAGRLVVLKLGPHTGQEHLCLARLQHSHIVPLYSVHEFLENGLRGLCLPYFGGATLADLLGRLVERPPQDRTGLDLLRALRGSQKSGISGEKTKTRLASLAVEEAVPGDGPACRFLARASYVEAVCWLGACLADALQYAQERELVHLDLKPSNVLLAADGQPMLLDFHLARPPLHAGTPALGWLGGTPGYMAPEHEAALEAVAEGRALPAAVDGRADLYSLGRLLCEMLGGPSSPKEVSGTWTRRCNPNVSRGLANVLDRCLAAGAEERYGDAASLAADLRRHLADLPLRGTADGGLAERWRKWRRRQPSALPLLILVLGTFVAAAMLLSHAIRQVDGARAALGQGQESLERHHYADALGHFESGFALVEDLPFTGELQQRLSEGRLRAKRAAAAEELHRCCEELYPLSSFPLPVQRARAVADQCRQFWNRRNQLLLLVRDQPDSALREQVRADLLDLAILRTHLCVRLAPAGDNTTAHEEALAILARTEKELGPSCVLYQERRAHALALRRAELAEEAERGLVSMPPANAREHVALGQAYFLADEPRLALRALDCALELQPGALWPTFYRGCCASRLGQHDEAVVAFSVCLALAPDKAWCFCNRGLAYFEWGRLDQAQRDLDRALQLDPSFAAAALGRGALHHRAGRHEQALADLNLAARSGLDTAALHYNLALVQLARGERAVALACAARAVQRDSAHRQAHQLLLQLREHP